MARRKVPKGSYRVVDGTSTRVSADPDSPDYERWVTWEPGDIATEWPAHADVEGWVASGHWVPEAEEEG